MTVGQAQQVAVRVSLLEPTNTPYKVEVVVRPSYVTNIVFFVGKTLSSLTGGQYTIPSTDSLKAREDEVAPVGAGQATPWIDLTGHLQPSGLASVEFLFVPTATFTNTGVRARFEVARAPDEKSIVRPITEHDPGNIITLRVPRDLDKDKAWLLSIREDSERRLKEIRDFGLPAGPLPKKIWLMTGFRPWGMSTDPAITELDFQVIHELGMNGYWDFTPETWKLAPKFGIDRTTVYWRAPGAPPGFGSADGIRLDWDKLGKWVDEAYKNDVAATRKIFGGKLPPAVADLMDEPAGVAFKGPEYDAEFEKFLRERGFTPGSFGKATWEEVQAVRTPSAYFWWDFFKTRKELDLGSVEARRLFYWSAYFVTVANTRLYTLGTQAAEKYAPELVATRVNMGPPWWYDYGTIPRGMDNFDMGRLRGITMPFNEDWIGNGDPRWPLETNTLLADWDRAPFRPRSPIGGGYLTRDANRTAIKLRAFGFLARDCKIFDFYYYGPAYGHFDHWSDNASMVQGVAELSRDIGRADPILWEGHPPTAKVALLYSRSWPVWKEDDTEQIEFMMVYLALLHAGLPVDIISDDQVEAGGLKDGKYQCLYVVNESVPAKTAAIIESWVKDGGWLWASGWAAAKDEYNTPSSAWNEMLGIRERSWKPAGDLKRMGDLIYYADERRPFFSRQEQFVTAGGKAIPDAEPLCYAAGVVPPEIGSIQLL
jgi:hypothetical protein